MSMQYLEWLKKKEIPCIPFRIYFKNTGEKLSNGDNEKKKIPCGDKTSIPEIKFDYGEELAKKQLVNNLMRGETEFQERIIIKMNDFDRPYIKELCKKKWEIFENGNPHGWNAMAIDTRKLGVIDIDCDLKECMPDSQFLELLKTYPHKKSTSKAYGYHIFFDNKEVQYSPSRRKNVFGDEFGVCKSGSAGIEFLNGIWEWAMLDDRIENPQGGLEPKEWLMKELKKIILNNQIPVAKAEVVQPVVPTIDIDNYPIDIIKENLKNYETKKLKDVQTCVGIILCFASSCNEEIYQIILNKCKLPEANTKPFKEKWVRDHWESFSICRDEKYKKTFQTYWCIDQNRNGFDWSNWSHYADELISKRFCEQHSKNFICNMDYKKESAKLCYYDNANGLWKQDPKTGIGKSQIFRLLQTDEMEYWYKIMKEEIEQMPEVTEKECELKLMAKHLIIKTRQNFYSPGNWINGTIKSIYNSLLYDLKLKKDIKFNLMPKSKRYFQFKNGAFNLKTGVLEKRTRDMYVTREGILNYDYIDGDYSEELEKIKKMMEMIHPDPIMLEAFKMWRGYTLTGETSKQIFFIFLGPTAGNGKSTICEIFRDCFPCYVTEVGNDCVDDTAKNDKSLSALVNKPYRLLYIEEAKVFGLKIKKIVGQKVTKVKPLFMEEIDLPITFKLEMATNGGIDGKTDEGVKRRGRMMYFKSQFVDDEDDVDEENNIYLKDPDIVSSFGASDRMKIALFQYFAPYAKLFYEGKFYLPEQVKNDFADDAKENDEWEGFMEQFEHAEDEDIPKKDMLQYIYNHFGDGTEKGTSNNYTRTSKWKTEFQRRKYEYDSQDRIGGKRGVFKNIKSLDI